MIDMNRFIIEHHPMDDNNKNIMNILDKTYWDSVLKLRNDMLNAYKKEIENAKKTREHDCR